jgi:hypothetical protein
VERQVPVARAALEADEHHERRRDPPVEAEVVGPARAHGRGEVEAGLGEERARPLGQGGVVDRGGFALGHLDRGGAAVRAGRGFDQVLGGLRIGRILFIGIGDNLGYSSEHG